MIAALNDVSESLLRVMWPPVWQALGLAVVALIIGFVIRGASPSLRHWCWWIVLIRLCIPWSPESPVGLGNSRRVYATVFERVSTLSPEDGSVAVAPGQPAIEPGTRETPSPALIAFALWMAGSLGLFGVVALRSWKLLRIVSSLPVSTDEKLNRLATSCSAEVGLRATPRLRAAAAGSGIGFPCAAGIVNPSIVLPEDFLAEADEQELRAVLLHEMVHIRRFDVAANLFQAVLQCLFFFHPAVWFANRAIRRERELICDDAVIRLIGDDRRGYCRGILRSVAQEGASLTILPALNETKTELGQRLIRIMKNKTPGKPSFAAAAASIIILAAGCALIADESDVPPPDGEAVSSEGSTVRPGDEKMKKLMASWNTPTEIMRRANEGDVAAQRKAGRQKSQVNITTRILSVTKEAAKALALPTGEDMSLLPANASVQFLMPEASVSALMSRARETEGVKLMSSPEVTTVGGGEAQVSVSEPITVVAKAQVSNDPEPNVNYLTQPEVFGPSVTVFPWVYPEGYQVQLTADFHFREFLGYEEPREESVVNPDAEEPLRYEDPLPLVKNTYRTFSSILNDGQAVVVSGGELVRLGKGPNTDENTNLLFVLLSVTRIDEAGRRIYDHENPPFDPAVIPEQSRVQRISATSTATVLKSGE